MEALQRMHNRGSISTGYDIDNSCKFEPDNSEYLGKTPTSSGNRRTFTISMWIKRTEIGIDSYLMEAGDGDYNQSDRTILKFDSTDNIRFGGGSAYQRTTYRVFRDTSAWYHIVMAVDTTDSTAGNRLKLYVNGVQETSFSTSADPSQNFQYAFCKDDEHTIGFNHTDNVSYFAGYMSEVILVDGQQLAPTSFGEFDEDSGIWKPKNVSGLTFGTNGFYLDFKDASNLGNDASGGTDFTENNITSADQATDTPTNNFAINNIIDGGVNTSNSVSYKEGGTVQIRNQNTNYNYNFSTLGMTKGKWYAEFQRGNSTNIMIGIQLQNFDSTLSSRVNTYIGQGADNHGGAFSAGGAYFYNNTASTGHTAYGTSDILGIAVDCDNNKIYFSVNGTYVNSGNPASGSNGFDFGPLEANEPCFFVMNSYSPNLEHKANFGGFTTISISSAASDEDGYGNFEYAPPSGYYALCTKNLEEYG